MTKIRYGKYVLTPAQAEENLAKLMTQVEAKDNQIEAVKAWVRAQLALHQPYANHVDVSCATVEEMKDALSERLMKNLWCARCSNPWPCKHIGALKTLRSITRYDPDLEKIYAAIDEMAVEPRKGQMDVGL